MTIQSHEQRSLELAYAESGIGSPLVLIMGLNADSSGWLPHTNQWQRSFRCFAVDNRGTGRSPAPVGPYTTAEMADDYAALIRRRGLGVVSVVGISMGGAIAQELALRHPDLVRRLVLVATWAQCDPYTREVLTLIDEIRQHTDPATFTAHLQTLIWTPQWFNLHADDLMAGRQESLSVDRAALQAQVAACLTHDTRDRLGDLGIPTLVTAGGADRFVSAPLSEYLATHIPHAEFELFTGAGHVHHWEELMRFNDLVEGWLHG